MALGNETIFCRKKEQIHVYSVRPQLWLFCM